MSHQDQHTEHAAVHSHAFESTEITYEHEPAKNTKKIWKTFWILLGLTIAELSLGLSHYAFHIEGGFLLLFIKGAMIILSLMKAVYIVMTFMHLGDELRSFRLTILIPLLLFIWFIAAFLWDGVAYKDLRHKFDRIAPTEQVRPVQPKNLN